MRPVRAVVCGVVLGLLAGGCSSSGTPVRVAAVPAVPVMVRSTPTGLDYAICTGSDDPGLPGGPLVAVDRRPHSVVLFWFPGMNSRQCRPVRTTAPATTAARLAHDLDDAPRFPSGKINCPMDDDSHLTLYFRYAAGRVETATVGLRGCGGISAAHRAMRVTSPTLDRDLRPLAPPGFTIWD